VPGHADEDPVFGYLVAPRHYSRWCAAVHRLWSEHLQIQDVAKRTTASQLGPGEGLTKNPAKRIKRDSSDQGLLRASRRSAARLRASKRAQPGAAHVRSSTPETVQHRTKRRRAAGAQGTAGDTPASF
jgi:hypothetical protein